jgi:DNA-binding transcriptional regulator WhiA
MTEAGSFTQRVVAELAPHTPQLACCRSALVEGMRLVSGSLTGDTSESASVIVNTTRLVAARAAVSALHAQGVTAHARRMATARRVSYVVSGDVAAALESASDRLCCTRSRLRGAFLTAGRLTRPEGAPHLEIGGPTREAARRLAAEFAVLDVNASVRRHRNRWLVTVRATQSIGAALSSIGVQSGRLQFEAGRVVRDVRSGVNRRLNAETANLRRSATAGVRQIDAVTLLEADPARWASLAPALREAAALRRRHPDDDLGELAARAGCSRSAMAGRLRRLESAAAVERGARVE